MTLTRPTTTFALFLEGVDLKALPGVRRPIVRVRDGDGEAELVQCRGCGAFYPFGPEGGPDGVFRRLANRKSACGLVSECRRCGDLRRLNAKRAGGGRGEGRKASAAALPEMTEAPALCPPVPTGAFRPSGRRSKW